MAQLLVCYHDGWFFHALQLCLSSIPQISDSSLKRFSYGLHREFMSVSLHTMPDMLVAITFALAHICSTHAVLTVTGSNMQSSKKHLHTVRTKVRQRCKENTWKCASTPLTPGLFFLHFHRPKGKSLERPAGSQIHLFALRRCKQAHCIVNVPSEQ